jgi:hypothetical protein
MFVSSRKAIGAFWLPSVPSVDLQKSITFQRAYRVKRMAAAMISSPSWTEDSALIDNVRIHAA